MDSLSTHASVHVAKLVVSVIDTVNGKLCTVDAGHGYALLLRNGGSSVIESDGGPPVGAVEDIPFGESLHEIKAGDRIVLYSDGVAEEPDEAGTLFGVERTQAALEGSASVSEDVERVMAALRTFAGSDAFSDDVTVASLEIIEVG